MRVGFDLRKFYRKCFKTGILENYLYKKMKRNNDKKPYKIKINTNQKKKKKKKKKKNKTTKQKNMAFI